MNYRHVYHAGNFADVFKHIILTALIQSFFHKETPFCFLETHAGAGEYDLSSEAANKTKEYENGIAKLFVADSPPPLIKNYLQCVQKNYPLYPGSPLIAQSLLRPQDKMILSEWHPEEALHLKKIFARDKRVGVHVADGYQSLKAFLPPKERRGLVLIDPPYEKPDEYEQIIKALQIALARWETGIYAIWYPIKNRAVTERFQKSCREKISAHVLNIEFSIFPDNASLGLSGNGMIIVNPPWKLRETLENVLPWLWEVLNIGRQGGFRLELFTPLTHR